MVSQHFLFIKKIHKVKTKFENVLHLVTYLWHNSCHSIFLFIFRIYHSTIFNTTASILQCDTINAACSLENDQYLSIFFKLEDYNISSTWNKGYFSQKHPKVNVLDYKAESYTNPFTNISSLIFSGSISFTFWINSVINCNDIRFNRSFTKVV